MDGESLHILLVEDSEPDAELIRRVLRDRSGLRLVRVADESGLRGELEAAMPDIVLSDFSMPGFSGKQALRIVREIAPDLPFIFVSGTIGEELAIDALRRGASDYVLKDNLLRLPSAIDRAITGARERAARLQAEKALRESEERFRSIVEHSDEWIWEMGTDGLLTYSNPSVARMLGWKPEDLVGTFVLRHLDPAELEPTRQRLLALAQAGEGWQGWVKTWRHRGSGGPARGAR